MPMKKLVNINIKSSFSVSPEMLSAVAAEIQPLINDLEDLVSQIQTLSGSTEEFWNGESADEFRLRVSSNRMEVSNSIAALRLRANRLSQIAETAYGSEGKNTAEMRELSSINIQ